MYGALLALISCAGAWAAWRRHPLYAPTATFRTFAELVLLLIGAACAIFVTVHLTENKSFTVQMIALFSVIVILALGLIFSITAITTPKSARLKTTLPPEATLVYMYRRRVAHFFKISLVFFAIVTAACSIPGAVRDIAATLLAMGLLLGSIMLPTAYIMARKFDRAATALTLRPWIHWHYSPEEWRAWQSASLGRFAAKPAIFLFKRDWRRVLWVAVSILAGMLYAAPGSWLSRAGWAAASIGMVLLFGELAAWDAGRAPKKLKARLDSCMPDAYFGEDGVICDGLFFTWLGADVYLVSASIDVRDPRTLMMEFEKIIPNPYGSPNLIKVSQGVMLPKSRETEDLSILRQQLGARCPGASIAW